MRKIDININSLGIEVYEGINDLWEKRDRVTPKIHLK